MRDKRGFTLIELLVVLGLAGIVISVVMSFFIANYKSYNRLNTQSELQYQSQYMINYMTNKILEAENFDETTNIFNKDEADWFKFSVDNNTHELEYETSNPTVSVGSYLAEDGLTITSDGPEVTIELVLDKDEDDDPIDDYIAKQTVKMRNFN